MIVQVKWNGYKIWLFSNNISLYFENDTKYNPSYNDRLIGSRTD